MTGRRRVTRPRSRRNLLQRFARALGGGAVILVLALILIETLLTLASHLAEDRTSAWLPGATVRILAVGDSHTWGAAVARQESYPAHLQRFLVVRAPGGEREYEIIDVQYI